MSVTKLVRAVFSLAAGGLLAIGLLLQLGGTSQVALADPGALFVAHSGAGTTCTQGEPCTLDTALGQAVAEGVIYVAQGTYTGSGKGVVSIYESITL